MARTIDWQRTGGKTQRVMVTQDVPVDPLYAAYHAPIKGTKVNMTGSVYIWIAGPDDRPSLVDLSRRSFNGYPLPSFGSCST